MRRSPLSCFVLLAVAACSQEGTLGSFERPSGAPAGGPPPTDTIAAGGKSTCVRSAVGDVRCWGENTTGSLGIGNQSPEESAKPVEPTKLGLVKALFAGEESHCAIRLDDRTYCWGTIAVPFDFQGAAVLTPVPVITPFEFEGVSGPVAHIAIGRHFMCTLGSAASGAEVHCFGRNERGQLGIGSTLAEGQPTLVSGLDGAATSLSASMGGLFVCATTSTGSVFCWGDNANGQIGEGRGTNVVAPRKVDGLTGKANLVVAGGAHACARLESGNVACWGEGRDGQLGDGRATASAAPVMTDGLTDVVALAAGGAHTCAVRADGAVTCWGRDTEGQAGSSVDGRRPMKVAAASANARAVACGLQHSCAWGDGGRVECWGSNDRSQLGPRSGSF